MDISVRKLLTKMEDELRLAKGSMKQEHLREKVYSIKILCELILDEKQTKDEESKQTAAVAQPMMEEQNFHQPVSLNLPKKLDVDNGANGDSLFDF